MRKGKIIVAVLLGVLSFLVTSCESSSNKIGVIKMDELVYDFEGMKDATEEYTNKMNQWSAESDTLKKQLDQLLYDIKLDSINNNQSKIIADQKKFMLFRQKYYTLQQTIDTKAQEEDKKMTSTVMGQLNEYIEQYGKEHGYNLIINNTQLNNVGYVDQSSDITQEVLTYVNAKYNGE